MNMVLLLLSKRDREGDSEEKGETENIEDYFKKRKVAGFFLRHFVYVLLLPLPLVVLEKKGGKIGRRQGTENFQDSARF